MEYKLVAVKIGKREDTATAVQALLTDFGCNIKVRLGLHDLPEGACSPSGLVILQVTADGDELEKFLNDLNGVDEVTAKSLIL
ncbi:MAG: hypothetical protein PQJ60_12290 [Spirochaetales bacterium]|nr:hypothetical protein [Spirochaetales bacterium]